LTWITASFARVMAWNASLVNIFVVIIFADTISIDILLSVQATDITGSPGRASEASIVTGFADGVSGYHVSAVGAENIA
jgi:hypothetical protein